jgi:hypothetical protein
VPTNFIPHFAAEIGRVVFKDLLVQSNLAHVMEHTADADMADIFRRQSFPACQSHGIQGNPARVPLGVPVFGTQSCVDCGQSVYIGGRIRELISIHRVCDSESGLLRWNRVPSEKRAGYITTKLFVGFLLINSADRIDRVKKRRL